MDSSALASSLRLVIAGLHKGLRKEMTIAKGYSMTELETIGQIFKSDGILPTELAIRTRITTQSMSQILTKLESAGIIQKTPSETDGRKKLISITDLGREMVAKTRYERDEWLKDGIENMLNEEEMKQLERTIPILTKLIEHKR